MSQLQAFWILVQADFAAPFIVHIIVKVFISKLWWPISLSSFVAVNMILFFFCNVQSGNKTKIGQCYSPKYNCYNDTRIHKTSLIQIRVYASCKPPPPPSSTPSSYWQHWPEAVRWRNNSHFIQFRWRCFEREIFLCNQFRNSTLMHHDNTAEYRNHNQYLSLFSFSFFRYQALLDLGIEIYNSVGVIEFEILFG